MSNELYPMDAVAFKEFTGDSFAYAVTLKDETGAVVTLDLSSATFDFIVGTINESTSGVTITGGNGTVSISVTKTAMAALAAGDHDISLRYTISEVQRTLFKGTITLLEAVV